MLWWQSHNAEWKADLKDLYITAAKEVEVRATTTTSCCHATWADRVCAVGAVDPGRTAEERERDGVERWKRWECHGEACMHT